MEKLLHQMQRKTHQAAQSQGQNDLNDRLSYHGQHADLTSRQRRGDAEGSGEQQQTHRVVNSHNQQKKPGHRAVSLVLAHDHQRSGRGSCGGDGAQGNGGGQGKDMGEEKVQRDEHNVHQRGSQHSLADADEDGLAAGSLQLGQTELIADGKGDEAQSGLGNDLQAFHLLHRVKAQAGDIQSAQQERAQDQAGYQISGNRRQVYQLCKTGEHQAANQTDGQQNQISFHNDMPSLLFIKPAYHSSVGRK